MLTEFGVDSIREGAEEQAEHPRLDDPRRLRVGRSRHLRLLVDRRLVHGRLSRSPTGRSAWSTRERRAEAGLRGGAASTIAAPLPPPLERAPKRLGRHLRLQRRAHDGRLPRVAAHAAATRTTRSSSSTTARPITTLAIGSHQTYALSRGPRVHLSQENKGLSVARNVGDRGRDRRDRRVHRLRLRRRSRLARRSSSTASSGSGFVAVGGPNFPPPERLARARRAWRCRRAARRTCSLNDEVAEHIPGCNMAFRRRRRSRTSAASSRSSRAAGRRRRPLLAAAEPRLRDRLQPGGDGLALPPQHGEGLSQAADGLRQGGGAAVLQASVPLQHARPVALARAHLRRSHERRASRAGPIIYFGAFGRGLFQSLYEPPSSLLAYLPFTLEWNVARHPPVPRGAGVAARAAVRRAAAPALAVAWATATALRGPASIRASTACARRALIALLTISARSSAACSATSGALRGLGEVERDALRGARSSRRASTGARARSRSRTGAARGTRRRRCSAASMDFLVPRKYLVDVDPGWNRWDLEVYRGIWSQARGSPSRSRTTAAPSAC